MDDAVRSDRRRFRLREELADSGVSLRFDGEMGDRVLSELDYACFPPRHEREFPTYGALVVDSDRAGWSQPDLRVTDARGCSLDGLRLLADGRQSFVLFTRAGCDLAMFTTAHDRETALVRLQRETPHDLVIVQRTAHGLVRAYANRRLIVWDGARWSERPYADSYVRRVLRSVPEAPRPVLSALLDFCIHAIGPAPTGAALVWVLDEGAADRLGHLRRPVPRVQLPALSLLDPLAHGALRQLLGQLDGATVIDRSGRVVEAGVHLTGSDRSVELVRPRPGRGTRHGSARRFSFDESRTVVFVVSEDGPFTVYSDGAVVAAIDDLGVIDDGDLAFRDGAAAAEAALVLRCERCSKVFSSQVQPTGLGAAVIECPVCAEPMASPWPGHDVRTWVIKQPVEGT